MPRQTSHSVSQVTLKTNESNAPALGVFQSLNVTAPNSKSGQIAEGLAAVLGTATPFLNKAIEKNADKVTTRGINDELAGKADIKDMDRSEAYREGVEHVQVKKTVISTQAAWQAHHAELDKTMDAKSMAVEYDRFWRDAMGDVAAANPKMAAKMAPAYLHGMQELVTSHQAQLTKAHIADAEAVMQAEVADAYKRGEPIKFFELTDPLIKLTGDKQGVYTSAIESIGQQSVENGTPEVIAQVLGTVENEDGTTSLNSDFTATQRARLAQYHEAAEAKRLELQKHEQGLYRMAQEWKWQDAINSKMPIDDKELLIAFDEHPDLWTDAQITAWRARFREAGQQTKDTILFNGGLSNGKPYYMQVGDLDAEGKKITLERAQAQTNRDVDARTAAIIEANEGIDPLVAFTRAAVQTTGTQALPDERLQSAFAHAPVTDPQTLSNVIAAYAELPTSQRAVYVPDAQRRVFFENHLAQRDVKGDKEALLDTARADPDVVRKNLERHRPALNESHKLIGDEFLRDASMFALGTPDVKVRDLKYPQYAEGLIREGTELRMARGGIDVAAARKAATQDVLSTHMLVESGSGFRLIGRAKGVTEKIGPAITWIESQLPGVGKINGVVVPEGSTLGYPLDSRDNSVMIIYGPDGMPISPGTIRFPVRRIELKYTEHHIKDRTLQDKQKREQKRVQTLDTINSKGNPALFTN